MSTPQPPPTRTRSRWPRRLGVATLVGASLAGLLLLGANVWLVTQADPFIYEELAAVPSRTVAIVLGAAVAPSGVPSDALEDRLETARQLYLAGRVERILVSGDHGAPEYDETNAMHTWLLDRGVPSSVIFLDHAGFRTLDTMERAHRIFGVDDAIICTQAFHLARSVFLARRAGIDAVGLVADRRSYRGAASNQAREVLARGRAFVDSYILHTEPRFLGPPLPVAGNAQSTYDEWSRTPNASRASAPR